MEIIAFDYGTKLPTPNNYPAVYLERDNWDDYNYQTLFTAYLQIAPHSKLIKLGGVKIIQKGQGEGRTKLPGNTFTELNESYCSLGQEFNYYEILNRQEFRQIRTLFFKSMRDLVYDDEIQAQFINEIAFTTSMLRNSSAERAILDEYNKRKA